MNFALSMTPNIKLSACTGSTPFETRIIPLPANSSIVLGMESTATNGHTSGPGPSNGWFSAAPLSKKHAEVWVQSHQVYIRDLKSQHGTFVNGIKIERPSLLQSGDIITLGVEVSRTADIPSSLTNDQLKPVVAKISFSGI